MHFCASSLYTHWRTLGKFWCGIQQGASLTASDTKHSMLSRPSPRMGTLALRAKLVRQQAAKLVYSPLAWLQGTRWQVCMGKELALL